MLTMLKNVLLLCCVLVLTHCSTPGTYMNLNDVKRPNMGSHGLIYPEFIPLTPTYFDEHDNTFREYKVGAQDILTIIVWNHPELTIPSMVTTSETVSIYSHFTEYNNNPPAGILVNRRGEIFFPLAGTIKVAGLTVDQIRERITRRLVKYIRNPQVSVRVSGFRHRYVYVAGEVVKSGVLPMTDMPMTIMDAINESGGIDKLSSDAKFIYVVRGRYTHPRVYWLDATSPGGMIIARTFLLHHRDVVLISTAGVVRYSRVVNNILPTIRTFMEPPINKHTDD